MKNFEKFCRSLLSVIVAFSITFFASANSLQASFVNNSLNHYTSPTISINSQSTNLKKYTKLEKLICRYIDGKKRCWEE